MRLVDNSDVPPHLTEAGDDVGAFGEVQRSNDPRILLPVVDAELVAESAAFQDDERLAEFLIQLALPLERQVGRTDDENPLGEAAELQLLEEQARHDRLAGAGIVGQ